MNLLITFLRFFGKSFCKHADDAPVIVSRGEWMRGEYEFPHPSLKGRKFLMERQEFHAVIRCSKCGRRKIVPGYNAREIVSPEEFDNRNGGSVRANSMRLGKAGQN